MWRRYLQLLLQGFQVNRKGVKKQQFRVETRLIQTEMNRFFVKKNYKRKEELKLRLFLHHWRPLNLSSACAFAQPGVIVPVLELLEETLWPVLCRCQFYIIIMVLFGLENITQYEVECDKASLISAEYIV